MDITQTVNKNNRKNRRKKVETSQDSDIPDGGDNLKTVIDRKKISGNWEVFLSNHTITQHRRQHNIQEGNNINNNAFWKAKRLEKKHNLQSCQDKVNHKKDHNSTPAINGNEKHYRNIENNSIIDIRTASELNVSHKDATSPSEEVSTNNNVVEGACGRVNTLTRCVAIDCEMVGVGPYGRDSVLARISLVNKFGDCIYDKFVKPREKVTDYRTPVSGVRKEDLIKGESFENVQKDVAEIIKGRVLVGHAIKKDLEVLFLSHPKRYIRDTSKYKPFRKLAMGGTPSLKNLTRELLGVKIQGGEHNSVEDAKATMQLYAAHQRQWEAHLKRKKVGGTHS